MLEKYFSGLASEMELKAVTEYLSDEHADTALLQEVMEDFDGDSLRAIGYQRDRAFLLEELRNRLYPVAVQKEGVLKRISFKRIAVAAAVFLLVGISCFFMLMNRNQSSANK